MKYKGQFKVCPVCLERFERPSGKSDKVWKDQKCCGRNCSNIFKRKDKPQRPDRRKELTPGENRYAGWGKDNNEGCKFGGMTNNSKGQH